MAKRLSKTLWYGTDVDATGQPLLPPATTNPGDLDGLHKGELFMHLAEDEVTLWGVSSNGKVVKITGKSDESNIDLSDYLKKEVWDSVWEIREDISGQKYIYGKLPVVTQYGITMYADNGSLDIPSIYAGLPIDNKTLVRDTNGVLMINPNLDLGGGGGASSWDELEGIPSWIGATKPTYEYSEIQKTPDLSKYVSSDDLSEYVTLGGEQTITGKKNFTTGGLFVNGKQIQYDATNGCWKLEGNLLVTGGVTMYADGTTSGGSSAYSTLGSLSNVDDSIDASASVDRVLFQTAGSSEWVTKPLSEIGGSVSGDYLPLSGGMLSGTLYLNNNISISSYVDNVAYDIFRLDENNHLLVGYGHAPNGNTSIYGNNVYLRNGAARGYALTALANGNVGIGTTNPDYKLHVVGTGYFSNGINYSTATSSFNSAGIRFATNLARISVSSSGDMGIYATGLVSIRGNSQSGSSGTGLTIEGSGNASLTGKLTLAGTDSTTAVLEFSRDNFNYILFPNTLSIGKSTAGADRLLVLNSTDATFQCNILPSAKYTYNLGAYGTYFKQIHANEYYSGAAGNGLWLIGGNSADTTGVVIGRNSSATTTGAEICRFNANGLVWADGVTANIRSTSSAIQFWYKGLETNGVYLGNATFTPFTASTDLISLGNYNRRWKGIYLGISTGAYNNEKGVTFCDSSGNGVSRISQATNMGIISSGSIYLRPGSTKGASGTITASSIGATIDTSGNMLVTGGITMYSDRRKKTILNHVELSLKQIADAPLIEHYYNSDQEKTTHVGSIAQYWAGLNDWFCKKDAEGFYTMEIQNAALASAISIARHLERYESKTDKKIRQLKKRISQLEDELEKLKAA